MFHLFNLILKTLMGPKVPEANHPPVTAIDLILPKPESPTQISFHINGVRNSTLFQWLYWVLDWTIQAESIHPSMNRYKGRVCLVYSGLHWAAETRLILGLHLH